MENLELRNDPIWDKIWIEWKKATPYLPFLNRFIFALFRGMLIAILETSPDVWKERRQKRERKSRRLSYFFQITNLTNCKSIY